MIILNQNSNIRRIDELGRIVIPKDIRKKLHITDNESLEIFIDGEEIRIKKYSALPDVIDYMRYLVDMGNRITGNKYIITDRTNIMTSTDAEIKGLISENLENLVLSGRSIKNEFKKLEITENYTLETHINALPLMVDNDRAGMIIEYSDKNNIDDVNVIKIFKNLIEKKLDNY